MPHLLSVEHRRQTERAGCLAACVQMALQHIGIIQTQARLNRLFGLMPEGTPASRIQLLGALGVDVVYATGNESTLKAAVDGGTPPILFIDTGELPYWNLQLRHAVLMIGYDDVDVFLNDPAWDAAPMTTSWGDLMLAWSEFDYKYALIFARG